VERSSARRFNGPVVALATLISGLALAADADAAPKVTTVFSFDASRTGEHPWSSVTFDADGSLFGTTHQGGTYGKGTVFKLSPPKSGKGRWTRKILHSFRGGWDGDTPLVGLARAPSGALYGTTDSGGGGACSGGCGTVYELTPGANGQWTYSVIYRFRTVADGTRTSALPLLRGDALYGTTRAGGAFDKGTVFSLRKTGGIWTKRTLHSFAGGKDDGQYPAAGVVFGPDGALYGTTQTGGADVGAHGTVFRLASAGGAAPWNVALLHRFQGGRDGEGPIAPVAFDRHGALYGTTPYGGEGPCFLACGTVFRLAPASAGGAWETIYTFKHGKDGSFPRSGLTIDGTGALFGTTSKGGGAASLGTVYKLTPPSTKAKQWKETILHRFAGSPDDGATPFADVTLRGKLLYGTARDGGSTGLGTVFKLTR
jgi:uncharacterized repeat protein (TIGR03803 family)